MVAKTQELEADHYIKLAQEALEYQNYQRHQIPNLIIKIIEEDNWKHREFEVNEPKDFNYFPDFVEAPRPFGLQTEWEVVQDLCKGYPKAELAISHAKNRSNLDKAEQGQVVRTKTTKERRLMQLEKERPDLLEKVTSGVMTANQAFIQAGIKKPSVTVDKSPKAVVNALKKHFSTDEIAEIVKLLIKGE